MIVSFSRWPHQCPLMTQSGHPAVGLNVRKNGSRSESAQTGDAPIARPRFTIIEAPSVLGLFPEGVETLPDALLAEGLGERLEARRAGRAEPPQYDQQRDPDTMLLNPKGIAEYSVALADKIEPVVHMGEFPIVLGGDCSIVLGCLLALRRRGRYGLLFLDGHADFYQRHGARS